MYKFIRAAQIHALLTSDLWAQDSFEMHAIPSFLKSGDTVSIVATARWITPDDLVFATAILEGWGFKVKPGKYLHTKDFQLAGSAQQRREDFQAALDDPEVKAILVARGGYGTVHILDELDFSRFKQNPKWICGYSDITVLHAHLNSLGIATIHSTMPISFPSATPEALENLRLALRGELHSIHFGSTIASFEMEGESPIYGGNLSVLCSLLGSQSIAPQGEYFLFLEDVDEMNYHVDRMMHAIERSGLLKNARALILGGMTQMRDNTMAFGFPTDNPWGNDAIATIQKICDRSGIPVFCDFPAGHQNDNRAFYLGVKCRIKADSGIYTLQFQQG